MTDDRTETSDSGAVITLDSVLTLDRVILNQDGGDYLVGNPNSGVFISVPEAGAVAFTEMKAGKTISEATETTSRWAGQEVDVLSFAQTLVDIGLAGESTVERKELKWVSHFQPQQVRFLFSKGAWGLYSFALIYSAFLLLLEPSIRPSLEDFLFGPSYTLSLLAALAINALLTAGHESFHWLAAQAQGVGARFSLGHRFFLPTLDTDLSQLLALPRRARLGPLLAGIAFDGLLLGCVLSIQLGAARGWYGMPSTASLLLAVAGLILVLRLAFQPLIFLRSDLYAVMTTLLGCRNLYRVSLLMSKKRMFGLSAAERNELDNSHERDLQIGRYFSIVYMLGLVWAAWMLWVFVIPGTAHLFDGGIGASLLSLRLGSWEFWDATVTLALALLQLGWPLAAIAYLRNRRRQSRDERADAVASVSGIG